MPVQTPPPLPEFVAKMHQRKASGQLSVRSGEVERRFLFVDGELRAARSNSEDEMLGSWLVNRALITEGEKSDLLGRMAEEGSPSLGHMVVTSGPLDQATVDCELQNLAVEVIQQAARQTPHVTFFTAALEEDLPWDILPDFSTPQTILVIAREFPGSDARLGFVESLADAPLCLAKEMDDLMVEFTLTPDEGFILDRVRNPRSVDEIAASCGMPKQQVTETLYPLWTAGLVQAVPPEPVPDPDPRPYRRQVNEERLSSEQLTERARVMRLALSVPSMDHYTALGIDENAGHGEVVKAWKELSQKLHPDRGDEAHLADLGKELAAIHGRAELAYEVLSQPSARKRYDQLRQADTDERLSEQSELEDERQSAATMELVTGNLRQAEELISSGQARLAFTYLESASRMARDEDSLLTLAQLAGKDPAWDRLELETLKRLTEQHPGCVEGWIGLSNHWLRREDPERQRKALERALTVDSESEPARKLYSEHFGSHALDRVLQRTKTSSS
jgi:curved DNA-binding protein CbpA